MISKRVFTSSVIDFEGSMAEIVFFSGSVVGLLISEETVVPSSPIGNQGNHIYVIIFVSIGKNTII